MTITATRRALAAHVRKMTPDSDEPRAATSLLNALRNVEAHPDVPLMRRFLAEDLARAEAALTPRHGSVE